MRMIRLVPAALMLLISGPAFAQGQDSDPIKYVSKTDYFSIDFPHEPKVQEITYADEYRITLPGRVYTSEAGKNRYTVTVIDYRGAQATHAARNARCIAEDGDKRTAGDRCQDDSVKDIRGAIMYATWNFVQKAAKVTHLAYYNSDLIEGNEIHTINPDESRTYAVVHMHENRLYIAEATVPKGAPAANWFQISIQFLDEQYQPVRYSYAGLQIYSNGFPKPPRAGQGRQGGQGPQGGQGAAQPGR